MSTTSNPLVRQTAVARAARLFALVGVALWVGGCGKSHPDRPVSYPGLVGTWTDGTTSIVVYPDSTGNCGYSAALTFSPCGVVQNTSFWVAGSVDHAAGLGISGDDDEVCAAYASRGHTRFSAYLDASQTQLNGTIEFTRYSACGDPSCSASDSHPFSLHKQ